MIFLIPLAMWLCTAVCHLAFFKDSPQPFRRSLIAATVFIFFFIAAGTELLSAFNMIDAPTITVAWGMLSICLIVILARMKYRPYAALRNVTGVWIVSFRRFFKKLGNPAIWMLGTLLLLTCIVALVATPNNADSLSYHLSRLGYWVQNGNVEHYASHIERSISFSPFSEYVHLHSFLLSGTNRYFQLCQWFCWLEVLICISILVELFTDSAAALRIALFFGATLPIAVLESMTTQNDLVAAFYVMVTVFLIFDFVKNRQPAILFFLAPVLALGMLAKGTFLFYVLPAGIYLFFIMISRPVLWKPLAVLMGVTVTLVLLVNAPHWYRTYELFQSPLGRMSSGNQADIYSWGDFISSFSKHLFLHLGFISPGNSYNVFLENTLIKLHEILDTPLTKPGHMPFKMNRLNFNEDFAHNFIAIWLVLLSLPLLFFVKLNEKAKWYVLTALLSFPVFSFFIAYQTYGSRLHISFFMLAAPVIGMVYAQVLKGFSGKVLNLMLWLAALPFALLSTTHPLISTRWFFENVFPVVNTAFKLNMDIGGQNANLMQESVLFAHPEKTIWGEQWKEIEPIKTYINAKNPQQIGFIFSEASFDYGFQYSLSREGRTFAHVAVTNASHALEKAGFSPEIVLSEYDLGDILQYNKRIYRVAFRSGRRLVYEPEM